MSENLPKTPGIYKITNTVNGKSYIGSAVNVRKRCNAHKVFLRKQCHVNPHIQRAWDKYGAENFEFVIVESVETAECLIEREQFHIDTLRPGYNINPVAGNRLGAKFTPEQKARLSEQRKGRPGRPPTEDARRNMRVAAIAREAAKPPELRVGNLRKPMTEQARSKARERALAMSDEHKRKISQSLKGRNKGEKKPTGHGDKVREGQRKAKEARQLGTTFDTSPG